MKLCRFSHNNYSMECPLCNANSVIIKEGNKVCEAAGCPFIQFHLVTFQNQVRNFEDNQKEGRCNFSRNSFSETNNSQTKKLLNAFVASQKELVYLAEAMNFPLSFVKLAQQKLITILRVKHDLKEEKSDKKITTPDYMLAGYAFYCACFEKGLYFKDVRIANEIGCSKKDWQTMTRKLSGKMSQFMTVPRLKLEQEVLRIPQKHRINKVEREAMVEMMKRLKETGWDDGTKSVTICAVVFWQVMKRSYTYNNDGNFNIKKYLKPAENQNQFWTQKQFGVSYHTIKSLKDKINPERLLTLIPEFETRMPQQQIKD